jgi:hypothetical protein
MTEKKEKIECFECDWPQDRSRILSDLSRLLNNDAQHVEILSSLAEITGEIKNLAREVQDLKCGGDMRNTNSKDYQAEVNSILRTQGLKLERLDVKSMMWSGMGGGLITALAGIALALIYFFVQHKGS